MQPGLLLMIAGACFAFLATTPENGRIQAVPGSPQLVARRLLVAVSGIDSPLIDFGRYGSLRWQIVHGLAAPIDPDLTRFRPLNSVPRLADRGGTGGGGEHFSACPGRVHV